jgi:hypothetical protein
MNQRQGSIGEGESKFSLVPLRVRLKKLFFMGKV